MIKCSKCGKEKPKTEFYKSHYMKKDGLEGKPSWCKECKRCESLKWGKEHKERKNIRARQRRAENPMLDKTRPLERMGLSLKDYEKFFHTQGGKCAICGKSETMTRHGKLKRLAVDHNHKTGDIRGLLCSRCNLAIGMFEEDISILENAIEYLRWGRINAFLVFDEIKKCKQPA